MMAGFLAVVVSSAHAGLYSFTFPGTGDIPQSGIPFSSELPVSSADVSITGVELILTFADNTSLTGSGSGIQGLLNLGTDGTSVSFSPAITRSGTGSEEIFDVSFTEFNGSNPNDIWSLVLWDATTPATGLDNGLVSGELDITAVPEPVNVALGVFGGMLAAAGLARWAGRKWAGKMVAKRSRHEVNRVAEGRSAA
jgi:hypothetical protein